MKLKLCSLALAVCLPQAIHAQDAAEPSGDKEELLALLDEQTAIATRTRMNADYVPGMVTVLHGDELEARGARTVWEALALVPGIETAIERTGRRKVLIRGLGNAWASGNVKILLNDVSMNSAELGLADPVFNIPVEQVDRIEVIRGPGSAIYGEYAYMGVINVVTRADENRVFAFGGSFDTAGAGATLLFSPPEHPVQASLNLAAWRSSGTDAQTGTDRYYAQEAYDPIKYEGLVDRSNAPGPANEDVEAGTAVFKLGYERFSLTAQWTEDGLGDHFGNNDKLPPDPNKIVERTRIRTVDLRQELPLTTALTAGIQAGWKEEERRRRDLFLGTQDADAPDVFLDSDHVETTLTLGTDFTYRGWEKHAVLLAGNVSSVRVDESGITFDPPPTPDLIVIPEGTTRHITAITLQDEYRHSDLFTLTTGVRYDEYSDVGIKYSPRVAGVWRLTENHIVKAQYAEAFRPPTLYEVASADYYKAHDIPMDDGAIKPSTIHTAELGYIFKGDRAETRLTSFYSQLDDLVVFGSAESFGNDGATAKGVEVEQSLRISREWSLGGNVSYVETRDEETGEPFPGAAPWIANAGITYDKGRVLSVLQAHHVSGYEREATDSRDALGSYTTVDLTVTLTRVFWQGMQLRLGIKNLLDNDVRYPAPGTTYEKDYPRAERNWWTQISYQY